MPDTKNLVLSEKDMQALMMMGDRNWKLPTEPVKKKKRSFWGKLANIGSQALKPLSIPQAALFTGAAKIGHGLGLNNDVSWKNIGGDYYGNYTGAKMVGIDNKWAKLGTEIVVDPLWFVGGTKLAKLAKTAGDVNDAAKVGKVFKNAPGVKGTPRIEPESLKGLTKKQKKKLGKALTTPVKPSGKTGVPIEDLDRSARTALGRALTKPGGGKYEPLKADTRAGLGRALTTKTDPADIARVAEDAGLDASKLTDIELDEMGVMMNHIERLTERAVRHGDSVATGPTQAAIRFGTKKHNVNLRIPGTTRPAKSFTHKRGKLNLNPGFLNMAPAEEAGARIMRSGREHGAQMKFQIERVAKKFDLDNVDRVAVQLVGRAGDQSTQVIEVLTKAGRWGEKQHNALTYLLNLNRRLSAERGYTDLEGAIAKAQDAVANLSDEVHRAGDEMAPVAMRRNLEEAKAKLSVLQASPDYLAQGATAASLRELGAEGRRAARRGESVTGTTYNAGRSLGDDLTKSRVFEDPFKSVTPEAFVDDMIEKGFDPADAVALRDALGVERFADEAQKFKNSEVFYRPEWDAFTVAGNSLQNYSTTYARDRLVLDFLKKVGVPIESGVGQAARRRPNITNQPGSLGYHVGEYVKPVIIALKTGYTTVNLSHFVNNALGDLVNSWVNGNLRHVGAVGGIIPRNKIWRLANGDEKMLDEKFMINGVEKRGDELLAELHTAGIGHGMLQHDVLAMGENIEDARRIQAWLHDSTNPFNIVAKMSRLNARREGAQRMNTWLKHLRAGDDPVTAAEKTLRVHFDYQHLTAFEQNWMRNLMLFYVWIKRNTLLHSGGLLTRPALYASYADMERNRETFENEPSWYSEQGAISTPLGNFQFANPINDLHKIKLSMEGLRQFLVSPINPAGRMPLEMLFNKNAYTGRPVSDYPDQMKPHWLTELLQLGPETRARQGGERGHSINPYLGYIVDQLVGPQAARGNILTDPDYEGNRGLDVLASMLGAKEQRDKPVQFIRNKEAEEAAKKRSESRAANARKE